MDINSPAQTRITEAQAPLFERNLVLFGVGHGYGRFPVTVRFASVSAALTPSNSSTLGFAGQRASTLDPPFTFSPTFTTISASFGTHRSTRDPNRPSGRRPVHMHIPHRQKNAHSLSGPSLILFLGDDHHPAIAGRHHRPRLRRNHALRIAEEGENKQGE